MGPVDNSANMSTFITALLSEYHFYTCLQNLLISILCVVQLLGQSSFQVVAIQFGTDQFQGAPNDHLCQRTHILVFYGRKYTCCDVSIGPLFIIFKEASISLSSNLFSAIFVSVVLCIKSCFMSKWFSSVATTSAVIDTSRDCGSGNSNSYHRYLIYRVLKFAKKHTNDKVS